MTPVSVVRLSTIPNTFSETMGPIKLKLNMETPKDTRARICSIGPGQMAKMAITPICGKYPLQIFFSRTGVTIRVKSGNFGHHVNSDSDLVCLIS